MRLLTVKQLSARLAIPEKTIRHWVWRKKIPYLKVGKLLRFDRGAIALWLRRKQIAEK